MLSSPRDCRILARRSDYQLTKAIRHIAQKCEYTSLEEKTWGFEETSVKPAPGANSVTLTHTAAR